MRIPTRKYLRIIVIAPGIFCALPIHAQSPPAAAKFDVASIRPADPAGGFMFGIRPLPGGRITGTNVTLKLLITTAYGLGDYQLSGGSGWIETARYDIEAKPESPVVANDWREMLKSFLADRFQLVFHREAKRMPVYALVLAKKDGKLGPGMVESKAGGCVARDPSKPGPPGPGELPYCGNALGGASQISGTAVTPADILPLLSRILGRKVIDKTGLTGKYDIRLKYTPDENQPADTPAPALFTALQDQLGLKLESQQAPVEIFVIDRARQPSEN